MYQRRIRAGRKGELGSLSAARLLVLTGPFATIELRLDSLADEFCSLVLAHQRVNSLGHALRQPHKNRLHFQWWPPHAARIIRYRKVSQTDLPLRINDIAY